MVEEKKKVWVKLSKQDDIDRKRGLIKGAEEQESVKRFKAHLDYCRENAKKWK